MKNYSYTFSSQYFRCLMRVEINDHEIIEFEEGKEISRIKINEIQKITTLAMPLKKRTYLTCEIKDSSGKQIFIQINVTP